MPHTPHITVSSAISRIADGGVAVYKSRLVSSPNHSGRVILFPQHTAAEALPLTATPDNIIPKNEGVLIHGGSGEVLLTTYNGGANPISGNVLTGSDNTSSHKSQSVFFIFKPQQFRKVPLGLFHSQSRTEITDNR